MNCIEKSSELFNERHYHCSQAVFGAFAKELGISEELSLKIRGCFGAGMNEGEVCGCVTGALMALGLKYGQSKDDDNESRTKSRELCMEFYDKFKTENVATNSCCGEQISGICCIKVLGSGCKNCHTLYKNTKAAVENMKLNIEVEYVTDMEKIMKYGVMSMPALVVNEKVVAMGKVYKSGEIEKLLHKLGL